VFALGIITGYADNTFGGDKIVNRGQACVIIYRMVSTPILGLLETAIPEILETLNRLSQSPLRRLQLSLKLEPLQTASPPLKKMCLQSPRNCLKNILLEHHGALQIDRAQPAQPHKI